MRPAVLMCGIYCDKVFLKEPTRHARLCLVAAHRWPELRPDTALMLAQGEGENCANFAKKSFENSPSPFIEDSKTFLLFFVIGIRLTMQSVYISQAFVRCDDFFFLHYFPECFSSVTLVVSCVWSLLQGQCSCGVLPGLVDR